MLVSRKNMIEQFNNVSETTFSLILYVAFSILVCIVTVLLLTFGAAAIIVFWFFPTMMVSFDSWAEKLEKEDNDHYTGMIL